jgi:hypothetical protein
METDIDQGHKEIRREVTADTIRGLKDNHRLQAAQLQHIAR